VGAGRGSEKLIARLKNPRERARIRKEMENTNPTWESRYQSAGTWQNVQLAAIGRTRGGTNDAVSPNRKYEGMRVAEAAKQAGKDPFDFVFDLLIEERGSVGCVYFIIDEADLALAMKQPWVAVGFRWIVGWRSRVRCAPACRTRATSAPSRGCSAATCAS
jgi:N-acyl-D-aspartate/D-glutamate deacylase